MDPPGHHVLPGWQGRVPVPPDLFFFDGNIHLTTHRCTHWTTEVTRQCPLPSLPLGTARSLPRDRTRAFLPAASSRH